MGSFLLKRILATIPVNERTRLMDDLEQVTLPLGHVLYEPGDTLGFVYFPTSCIVSLVFTTEDGSTAELAMTGKDGLVGIPLVTTLLGAESLVYVFAILVFHSLVLFSLQSFYAALGDGDKVSAPALLRNLANPLIIGLAGGILALAAFHLVADQHTDGGLVALGLGPDSHWI